MFFQRKIDSKYGIPVNTDKRQLQVITRCYNGHQLDAHPKLTGEIVVCPVCGEDFIVGDVQLDDAPLEGSDKYWTGRAIMNIFMSLGTFAIAGVILIIMGPFNGKLFIYFMMIPGLFFALRSLKMFVNKIDIIAAPLNFLTVKISRIKASFQKK